MSDEKFELVEENLYRSTVNPRKWRLDFTLNGRRVRRVIIGPKSRAMQALILEKEKVYRYRYDLPGKKKRIRFSEYIDIYEKHYSVDKRSYSREVYTLNTLKAHFKESYLDEITTGAVERFMQKLKEGGIGNATINNYIALLRAILNKAIDSEDYTIDRNPVSKVKRLEAKSQRERILTLGEIERLMTAAESNPWGGSLPLFLTIALNTGMRKMEILSLQWKHINFDEEYIQVTAERSKSKKPRRIPMNTTVEDALRAAERRSEYVFHNPRTGKHILHVKDTFTRALREAKIKGVTVHSLRHTAASLMVNDCGVDVVTASKILGHSSIDMTMRYIHPSEEHKRRGVERLGGILNGSRHKYDTRGNSVPIEANAKHSYCYN